MRPELIENPAFLRYYEKWQKEPTSIVFAAISEIFRTYNMLDEAVQVAIEGLKHHPNLISGHLALAKAFLAKGEMLKAKDEAVTILGLMPNNIEAIAVLELAGDRGQGTVDRGQWTGGGGEWPLDKARGKPVDRGQGTVSDESRITSDEQRATSDESRITSDESRIANDERRASDDEDITEDMPLAELEGEPERSSVLDHEAWHTLTMAQILARQGHFTRARKIFKKILDKEPDNEVARDELGKLE